ncbi:hypothetical protein BKI52_06095 [marine bacterium AO1-C]|nr:hypothetical protein BKI52_06095 [marine bacterium AO1-C]
MKQLSTQFIIIILASLSFQALGQKQFYKAISGTYLDERSGEIVHLLWDKVYPSFRMFYQANEKQLSPACKIMEQLKVNAQKRLLRIKFRNSQYICDFNFKSDFQQFICINPDGSRQLFKRNDQPSKIAFADFLSKFPARQSTSGPIQVLHIPKNAIAMPPEWAMKFLVRQSKALREFVNKKDLSFYVSLDEARLTLLGKRTRVSHASFYYVSRLALQNGFYSVLFRVKNILHLEAKSDRTYLANFDKAGKLVGLRVVGCAYREYINSYTVTTTWIKPETMKVTVARYYGSVDPGIAISQIPFHEKSEIECIIESKGNIEDVHRFFEDITGSFDKNEWRISDYLFFVRKKKNGQYTALLTQKNDGEEQVFEFDFVRYKKGGNDDVWGSKFWLREKKQGAVWVATFNDRNTQVSLSWAENKEILLKR